MNNQNEKSAASSTLNVEFHVGLFKVKDYQIPYGLGGMDIFGVHKSIFPRSGDLILNLYVGDSFKNRITNYGTPWATVNKLYVSGLFSQGSLELEQEGNGSAFAIKLHPVIGYYLLKIPMCELVDKQVQISHVLESAGLFLRKIETSEQITSLNDMHIRHFFNSVLPEKSLYDQDPIYYAVNFIKNRNGCVGIRELSSLLCMSERTLNRNFLLKVGLSRRLMPKFGRLNMPCD